MTNRIYEQLKFLKEKKNRALRIYEEEMPILYPDDFFGFHLGKNKILDWGPSTNMTPNYPRVMASGFDALRAEIAENATKTDDEAKKSYAQRMIDALDECSQMCNDFREKARAAGNERLYRALLRVPQKPCDSFYEACVFLQLSIYFLRRALVSHIGIGRFDQYMYPYYLRDIERGVTKEELFETLEAFFISLNFDNDLYPGVQQGDNGQSMTLGGFDLNGESVYNELSEMCMNASLELSLIEPKINLRVGKKTPLSVYEFATHLTKSGLGFPQYCNDDVVVPGLIKLGYDKKDAVDYTVAACWEFLVPGCSAEVPNIAVMNFPLVVSDTVQKKLLTAQDFDSLLLDVDAAIAAECDRLDKTADSRYYGEQALLSVYTSDCIERLQDLWFGGGRYNNFGCHGTGIANAADALYAIKETVFDEGCIEKAELLSALEANFVGYDALRNRLRACVKMGNDDDRVDDIAARLMATFGKCMNRRDNRRGGVWRAGTGSAMEYLWSASRCPATADGRGEKEPYSSSFSPSLDVKTTGLLSVIKSFTKYDMSEIINGGPLTLEIHDTLLRNDTGIKKTAQLVKLFVDRGGHQLQLNAINRERLLDAQKHPENYPGLIVRVWGWSGYFNELDVEYQNHIIRRTEYFG